MSTNRWVVRVADGQFCLGRGPDPAIYLIDQVNYGVVDLGDTAPTPDERTQKWGGSSVVAKTTAEIATFDASEKTARFTATSRQKDILAMLAVIVRAKNTSAWNAMTPLQKKTATFAEADVWIAIRQFIEDNL